MGGPGSGNWCRWNTKDTTEANNRIDIRYMTKQGCLTPGTAGILYWTRDGERTGSIGYSTYPERIELKYQSQEQGGEPEDVRYSVFFDETTCNYGGTRKWFLCPGQGCNRRVAVLYGAGKYFLCRHCHNLAYSSQNEDRANRAARKARKTIEKLGCDPFSHYYPGKPKGMHWRTYDRLINQAEFYRELSWHYMGQWMDRFRVGLESKR